MNIQPRRRPGRVAIVAFATLQGLAAMANGGMIEGAPVSAVVSDAIEAAPRVAAALSGTIGPTAIRRIAVGLDQVRTADCP